MNDQKNGCTKDEHFACTLIVSFLFFIEKKEKKEHCEFNYRLD